ncbi:MAG: hypothetical protein AB7N71_11090 [Phycisphaerae bacterium]
MKNIALAVMALSFLLTACGVSTAPPDRVLPVTIYDVAFLKPPAVRHAVRIYQPNLLSSTADTRQYFAFAFTVQTNAPDGFGVQFLPEGASGTGSLLVERSSSAEVPSAREREALIALVAEIDSAIADDSGVFTLLRRNGKVLRVGVALPATLLSGRPLVRAYDTTTEDGTPLQFDQFALTREFFYIAVVGDSVLWGNGLREEDKYPAIVAREIEAAYDVHVVAQRFAQNGAPVKANDEGAFCEFDCFGEVPTILTSLETQAMRIERPELVQLVLTQGCINDVGLPRIVDPEIPIEELSLATDLACRGRMRDYLAILQTIVPNAKVLVMGYYPIVGSTSDLFGVEAFFQTNTGVIDEEEGLILPDPQNLQLLRDQVTIRAQRFREESDIALQTAVDVTRSAFPAFDVTFLASTFGPENAVFTADAYLWGMTNDNPRFDEFPDTLQLFPEDDVQDLRYQRCLAAAGLETLLLCLYTSVGHPNRAGAASYAAVVMENLRATGFLP